MALEAGILCFNVRIDRGTASSQYDCRHRRQTRAGQPARQPGYGCKTHPYISTGLRDNKFGIAYHDARCGPTSWQQAWLTFTKSSASVPHWLATDGIAPFVAALEKLLALIVNSEAAGIRCITLTSAAVSAFVTTTKTPIVIARPRAGAAGQLRRRDVKIILEPGSPVGNAGCC